MEGKGWGKGRFRKENLSPSLEASIHQKVESFGKKNNRWLGGKRIVKKKEERLRAKILRVHKGQCRGEKGEVSDWTTREDCLRKSEQSKNPSNYH